MTKLVSWPSGHQASTLGFAVVIAFFSLQHRAVGQPPHVQKLLLSDSCSTLDASPSGRFVAASSLTDEIAVWELSTGKKVGHLKSHEITVINSMLFQDDEVLTISDQNGVWFWNWRKEELKKVLSGANVGGELILNGIKAGVSVKVGFRKAQVIKGREVVFFLKVDGEVGIANVKEKKITVLEQGQGLPGKGMFLDFHLAHDRVLFSLDGTRIEEYEFERGKRSSLLQGEAKAQLKIATVLPKRRIGLLWDEDLNLYLLRLDKKSVRKIQPIDGVFAQSCFAPSSDGKRIAVSLRNSDVVLLEVHEDRLTEQRTFAGPQSGLVAMSFAVNDTLLIGAGEAPQLHVWNLAEKK